MKNLINNNVSISKIGIKSGVLIFGFLVLYFLIMKHFNIMDNEFAWGGNFIILLIGLICTYSYYRSKTNPNIAYIPGLALGFVITVASVLPFVLFLYYFFSQIDPVLLLTLKSNILFMGQQITPERVVACTLVEGISSGVIMSFIIMQYYKAGFKRVISKNDTRG